MENKSILLKGILDGCTLLIISRGPVYGYELLDKLRENGLDSVSKGSIYPLLLRLQKKGYIESKLEISNKGPERKYYSITFKGRDYLDGFIESWTCLNKSVEGLISKTTKKI